MEGSLWFGFCINRDSEQPKHYRPMKPSEKIAILFDKFPRDKQEEILEFLMYLLEKENQEAEADISRIRPFRNPDSGSHVFRYFNA